MPEQSAGERTEEATPRRRQQARERGQVAKSRDLNAAIVMFVAVLFFRYAGTWMLTRTMDVTASLLERAMSSPLHTEDVYFWSLGWMVLFLEVAAPFLLLLLVTALVVNFAQVGFAVSWEAIALKPDKLNPVQGFQRLVSLRGFMTLIMSLAKVGIVLAVAYLYFSSQFGGAGLLTGLTAKQGFAHSAEIIIEFMLYLAAVLLVIAVLDYGYQRYQHEQDLRMTKQEVIEEQKDTEGDPHMRARRRARQRELAQQRMMAAVPEAEVVVRNPDHFSVALAYDIDKDPVPYVVAKGVDHLAMRINEAATRAGVPMVYNPRLARQLYYRVEIDEPVPEDLWQAVVAVLAQVYRGEERMARKRKLEKALHAA